MGRFFCFSAPPERGNALLYVLLAVGLLGALTYSYVQSGKENYAAQSAVHISEQLFAQVNMIKAAAMQCVLEYPAGGGDMDGNGVVDASDNPNNPYPINPSSALNAGRVIITESGASLADPIAAAANDQVRNLTCVGAPSASAYMFQGAGNQGRFLPAPLPGFSEWVYNNAVAGVYIETTAPGDVASTIALTRLLAKFNSAQASVTGSTFRAWILKN